MDQLDENEILLENLLNEKRSIATQNDELITIQSEMCELERLEEYIELYFNNFFHTYINELINKFKSDVIEKINSLYKKYKIKDRNLNIKILEFKRDFGVI